MAGTIADTIRALSAVSGIASGSLRRTVRDLREGGLAQPGTVGRGGSAESDLPFLSAMIVAVGSGEVVGAAAAVAAIGNKTAVAKHKGRVDDVTHEIMQRIGFSDTFEKISGATLLSALSAIIEWLARDEVFPKYLDPNEMDDTDRFSFSVEYIHSLVVSHSVKIRIHHKRLMFGTVIFEVSRVSSDGSLLDVLEQFPGSVTRTNIVPGHFLKAVAECWRGAKRASGSGDPSPVLGTSDVAALPEAETENPTLAGVGLSAPEKPEPRLSSRHAPQPAAFLGRRKLRGLVGETATRTGGSAGLSPSTTRLPRERLPLLDYA